MSTRPPRLGARRALAGVVAATAALTLVSTSVDPAASATSLPAAAASPSGQATAWLGGELRHGLMHNSEYGFDDYGLTVDAGLAFVATGRTKQRNTVRSAMAEHVDDYTTGAEFGSPDAIYAGATGKLLSFAIAAGANPRSYGGVDLVQRSEDVVADAGPITGRIEDAGGQDYANVIGQAYTVRGLSLAGSDEADAARVFLLQQQCDAGYFRLNLTPNKSAADQSCDGARKAARQPDTDATAIALLSLIASGADDDATKAAIKFGTLWLRNAQRDNGGFGGGPTTRGVNANSTGLAGAVLASRELCGPARRAARVLQGLQLTRNYGSKRFKERGAVAYDRAGLRAIRSRGITRSTQDQARRATVQAAPTLLALTPDGCHRL